MPSVAMATTAERGGSFGRGRDAARATMRAAAPGTAFRFPAAESSPLGGARRWSRPRAAVLLLLALAGAVTFGNGAWLYAKASLGQWLLLRAWAHARAVGGPVKPW